MFGAGRNLRKIVENSFGQNPLEGFSFYNATDRLHRLKKPVNKEMVKKLNQDSIKRSKLEMKLHTIGKPDNAYLLPEFVLNAGLWTIGNPAVYQ